MILSILHLGLLRISLQHRYIIQTSIPSFSFLCCYLFSKWYIYFFILFFSDPILFCLFLFLYTTFPVFYFLSFFSICLSISSTLSFSFCLFVCLSSTFFLAVFYLSSLIFFVYHLLSVSASVSFVVFWFPSWLSSTFFLSCHLLYSPYSSLSLFEYMCFIIIILFFFSVFSTFQLFVCLFCLFFYTFFLFCFSYFVLFSTLFDYLVLVLDFNYYKFSLLFIFSINLCYLSPFSFAVFFTKFELFIFLTFQHMLCGVFWFFT